MNGLLIVFWCDLVVDKILVDLTYLEDSGFLRVIFGVISGWFVILCADRRDFDPGRDEYLEYNE